MKKTVPLFCLRSLFHAFTCNSPPANALSMSNSDTNDHPSPIHILLSFTTNVSQYNKPNVLVPAVPFLLSILSHGTMDFLKGLVSSSPLDKEMLEQAKQLARDVMDTYTEHYAFEVRVCCPPPTTRTLTLLTVGACAAGRGHRGRGCTACGRGREARAVGAAPRQARPTACGLRAARAHRDVRGRRGCARVA